MVDQDALELSLDASIFKRISTMGRERAMRTCTCLSHILKYCTTCTSNYLCFTMIVMRSKQRRAVTTQLVRCDAERGDYHLCLPERIRHKFSWIPPAPSAEAPGHCVKEKEVKEENSADEGGERHENMGQGTAGKRRSPTIGIECGDCRSIDHYSYAACK